jgi:lipoate---protein ligase
MLYIENLSTTPYHNLACEEYILKQTALDRVVMLWQNDNSIIVGRHQNTLAEINSAYVAGHGIRVARRITGGGAVYHDLGNLNFSFILNVERIDSADMKQFALPVLSALQGMGVPASLSGRNDLEVGGKKISGTAQALVSRRLLFHGTLLFNSDLDVLTSALNVPLDKIASKGIASIRSRVTNISEHLSQEMDVLTFRDRLLQAFERQEPLQRRTLGADELAAIAALERDKFATWEWNYGRSPSSNVHNARRFAGGKVEALLDIVNGRIRGIKFYGDFLGPLGVDAVEQALLGLPYTRPAVEQALAPLDMALHFGAITPEEVLSVILG